MKAALFALMLFIAFPAQALAQGGTQEGLLETVGAPAQSDSSTGLGGAIETAVGAPALAIVVAFAWVIQSLAALLLPYGGAFLDFALETNITFNPANMPVVQIAWRVTRDLANSFFILIVLWIAFTIIFNLQNLGGTKLLARVIVIAILINFSLAIVSGVFGLTNTVAEVFSKNMPRDQTGTIATADFIIGALNLQGLNRALSPDDLAKLKESAEREKTKQSQPAAPANQTKPRSGYTPRIRDTAIAALGIEREARAAPNALSGGSAGFGLGAAACAVGIWLGPLGIAGCGVTVLASTILGALFGFVAGDLVGNLYRLALWYSFSAIFYTIAAATFFIGALTLITRLLAMVYLSALAPLALLTFVVPGGGLNQYFTMWKNSLIKWATFAPMFYFLFYLALFMLDQFAQNFRRGEAFVTNVAGELSVMLGALVVCMFMIAAIKIARTTGDAVSTAVTNIAKTAGGFAIGAAAGGALGIGKRLGGGLITPGGRIQKTVEDIAARSPAAVPVRRAIDRFIKSRKKRIEEEEADAGTLSDNAAATEFRSAARDLRKVALALKLAKSDDQKAFLEKLSDVEQKQALELTTQSGVQKEILQKLPHLATGLNVDIKNSPLKEFTTAAGAKTIATATEKAVHEVMKKIGFDDKMKLSAETYKNKDALRSLVLTSTTRNLSVMAEQRPEMIGIINTYLENLSPDEMGRLQNDMGQEQKQQLENYWNGNLAQGAGPRFGYKKPDNWQSLPPLPEPFSVPGTYRATATRAPGSTYQGRIAPTGGTPPYRFEVKGGSYPPDMTIGPQGQLGGPVGERGTYQAQVDVTDNKGAVKRMTIEIIVQ